MAQNSVLIVEDEIIVAESIQRKLTKMGYSISEICTTSREVFQAIEGKKPDLILMDIKLQGDLDGIEIARSIKERYDLPIVYLTAYADEKTLERAKLTTPYGYVLKPFTDRELRSNIEIAFYKHKIETELKESERRFRTIIQTMQNGIVVTDSNWNITFANEKFCRFTGYPKSELNGKSVSMLLDEENREIARQAWDNNIITEGRSFELSFQTKLNEIVPIVISPKLHLDENGEPDGCVITVTDLTFYRHYQTELGTTVSQEILDNIEKNSKPAMVIDLASWHVAEVNEPFLEEVDYPREEVVNHSAIQFANWKKLDELNAFLTVLNSKINLKGKQLSIRKRSGDIITVSTDLHLIEKNGTTLSLLIFDNTGGNRKNHHCNSA